MIPTAPLLSIEEVVERSELVLLAVPDDALGPLVAGLAKLNKWQTGQLLVHPSGSHGIEILAPAAAAGAIPLALHPAMTFTGTSLDLDRLQGCPFAVTAPNMAVPIAQALVLEMGGEPFVVPEENRVLYHAGLCHGANHLVLLVNQALEILAAAGIEQPDQVASRLLQAALERAISERLAGITGPVSRGDAHTVAAHLQALTSKEDLACAATTYRQLAGDLAQTLADNRQLSAPSATALAEVLRPHTS